MACYKFALVSNDKMAIFQIKQEVIYDPVLQFWAG